MLNTKALSDLLSQNRDERLCKRWYLMTPNGTLLAYSRPTNINDLRRHAAITAITWQEHQTHHLPGGDDEEAYEEIREDREEAEDPLRVLTIELESSNVILRQIQTQLLLVLEGGIPPRRAGFVKKVTAEGAQGRIMLHDSGSSSRAATPVLDSGNNNNNGSSGVASNVLKLQRKKLDAVADAISSDFQQTDFKMPENGGSTMF